jgi:phosphoribosylformylglycinamidine synthase
MARMRAAVLLFPGTNAEQELIDTLEGCGIASSVVRHDEPLLPPVDLVAIPGGFAHGDYLRPGALARASRVVPALLRHAARGGFVLGICNGFQILTEIGLLPGALGPNAQLRFECRAVHVRVQAAGPFSPDIGSVLRLPIAHAVGAYHADRTTVRRLQARRAIALRYCDEAGRTSKASNPNGSLGSIAGLYGGPAHNILGLMPHPERMSDPAQGGTDGRLLFQALLNHVAARGVVHLPDRRRPVLRCNP